MAVAARMTARPREMFFVAAPLVSLVAVSSGATPASGLLALFPSLGSVLVPESGFAVVSSHFCTPPSKSAAQTL